jgi:hypothetical protein
MAFAYTVEGTSYFGDKKVAWGTFTNGGSDTGGDIKTGLTKVECFLTSLKGSAVIAAAEVINETLPLSSGDVTIVTNAGDDGYWFAIGVGA